MSDLDRVRAAVLAYRVLRLRGVNVEDAMRQAWAAWFGAM